MHDHNRQPITRSHRHAILSERVCLVVVFIRLLEEAASMSPSAPLSGPSHGSRRETDVHPQPHHKTTTEPPDELERYHQSGGGLCVLEMSASLQVARGVSLKGPGSLGQS